MNEYNVYKLDSDGRQEDVFKYQANNGLEAMKKHLLSLSNDKIKESDIYKTENGYSLNVLSYSYWVRR